MHCKKVLFISVLIFAVKQSAQSPVAVNKQDDIKSVDVNMDIACITNATCLKNITNNIVRALKLKRSLDFGLFTVDPLKNAQTEGRSFNKFWDIASSNSIRVPFGAYSVNVQKSDEHENYLEVALSKTVEGEISYIFKSILEN